MRTNWINLFVKLTGIAALIAGVFLVILGPAELACFPWYMEGGRFHYDGFRYGSLIYAIIVGQVIVYPLIGAILAAIGYGHIKEFAWTLSLVRGLSSLWLILGLPLMPVFLFLTLSFKALSDPGIILLVPIALIIYPIAPLLARKLYHTEWLSNAFTRTSRIAFDENIVIKVILLVLTGLVLVGALLLRGVIPVFGLWLHGGAGIIVTIVLLVINSIILALNIKHSRRAGGANLIYTIYWLVTALLSIITFDWHTLLEYTNFASVEKQAMLNIPIQGVHIALAVLPSLIIVLILQLRTSKHAQ